MGWVVGGWICCRDAVRSKANNKFPYRSTKICGVLDFQVPRFPIFQISQFPNVENKQFQIPRVDHFQISKFLDNLEPAFLKSGNAVSLETAKSASSILFWNLETFYSENLGKFLTPHTPPQEIEMSRSLEV